MRSIDEITCVVWGLSWFGQLHGGGGDNKEFLNTISMLTANKQHLDARPIRRAYFPDTGKSWAKIDYSWNATTWMNPLGARTLSPVETPFDGYIDDLPPTMFAKLAPRSNDIWRNNFIVLMMNSSSHLILPGPDRCFGGSSFTHDFYRLIC
ncbi:polysaccharide deacetylase family protein [Colletotrichum cuscutae]|uniref:Polysaccharide deacetylase family protein n=1 Tax=Colletotrichum cuscutae TaxID=1209917 RepID=A0AAI9Y5Y4_9PEZI|nr:polysaccharide deacetylase family protein [Colletotrichum cuscutae]